LSDHRLYRALGRNARERQTEYRLRFRAALQDDFVEALRNATNGGWAMGGERFRAGIAQALKRRVVPLPPGPRPKPSGNRRWLKLL
jgi:putative transposase